jgi:hypothetical protein
MIFSYGLIPSQFQGRGRGGVRVLLVSTPFVFKKIDLDSHLTLSPSPGREREDI